MAKFTIQRRKECSKFIGDHHGKMTQQEMVKQLGVSHQYVTTLVKELGLQKRFYNRRPVHTPLRGKGLFNVNRHPDWLVG